MTPAFLKLGRKVSKQKKAGSKPASIAAPPIIQSCSTPKFFLGFCLTFFFDMEYISALLPQRLES